MQQVINKSNRTSLLCKAYNCVPSQNTFAYQFSRRQAYMQRLYFEFLYTEKVKGQTFFYTLTYNDKSIPYYEENPIVDIHCFNYEHIRYITHGALEKVLKRKYGTRLRYFCACETGEGKGKRGLGCNPHYHFVFFLQPLHDKDTPIYDGYTPISPVAFRNLVRDAWQGTHKYIDFQKAKFGIAKEGDLLGLVINQAALRYVSKYVCKDSVQLDWELRIADYWKNKLNYDGLDDKALDSYYHYVNLLNDDGTGKETYTREEFDKDFAISKYLNWRNNSYDPIPDRSYYRWINRYCDLLDVKVNVVNLLNPYFEEVYKPEFIATKVREFSNKYSGKPRMSKSLGQYGLNFVISPDHKPSFSIPNGKDSDLQPISLFYYRKLYYNTYKCDVTGNVLYRLNELGIKVHFDTLEERIQNIVTRLHENVSIVQNELLTEFQSFRNHPFIYHAKGDFYVRQYAIYKLVYEFRCFDSKSLDLPTHLFEKSVYTDCYKRFLENDSYLFDWDYSTILLKRNYQRDYQDFKSHYEVKPYLACFLFFDELMDSVDKYRDNACKRKFQLTDELRRKHNAQKYQQSSLNL